MNTRKLSPPPAVYTSYALPRVRYVRRECTRARIARHARRAVSVVSAYAVADTTLREKRYAYVVVREHTQYGTGVWYGRTPQKTASTAVQSGTTTDVSSADRFAIDQTC